MEQFHFLFHITTGLNDPTGIEVKVFILKKIFHP